MLVAVKPSVIMPGVVAPGASVTQKKKSLISSAAV